jgi:glycine dehydrogenase subunit 2
MTNDRRLIFELGCCSRSAYSLPQSDVDTPDIDNLIPQGLLREKEPLLPEVSEVDVIRHYTGLSKLNYAVDGGYYPLGSCTMKYNPKVNEDIARFDGFAGTHPYQDESTVQGSLELMYDLDTYLCELTGMDRFSMQPAAGAHGEMTGLMIIKAYHQKKGESKRNKIIVPDSAHGTNPASAAVIGYQVVEVKSNENGGIDIEALKNLMSDEIAGLMLTNPNTLGLFDENILEISNIVHNAGGLLYYDGANMNAIMGICRPGDMGFDVIHLNLHKTFSTPHGGGGPGAGPVGVKKDLVPFLPVPFVDKNDTGFFLDYNRPDSIGKIKAFYGNFLVAVRAYSYILSMGKEGLREASEMAVLNANYLMNKLKKHFNLPYDRVCMHEFVLSGVKQKANGVSTLDMAKRIMDYGFHPPTVYFPLIVKEALMIEPTETESKETLDMFIEAMINIAKEAEETPEKVTSAPKNTVVTRLDEVRAVKTPVLRWYGNAE